VTRCTDPSLNFTIALYRFTLTPSAAQAAVPHAHSASAHQTRRGQAPARPSKRQAAADP
jgi:hypothetical protein